jgi:RsiW-degrading membrane proteinase PrsW (M82 family)
MLACMKGEQMAAQASQTSFYSNVPTIPHSPPPKKLSRPFTIISLAAATLGFTLVAVGLVQNVNGEGGTPLNMRFAFLNKVGWDIPVTSLIAVMLFGVVLLLIPIMLAFKYDRTSALWGLLFMLGAGGMAWGARQAPAQATRMIPTTPWGNDASLVLVFVFPLLAVGAYLIAVHPLLNRYRKFRNYQQREALARKILDEFRNGETVSPGPRK